MKAEIFKIFLLTMRLYLLSMLVLIVLLYVTMMTACDGGTTTPPYPTVMEYTPATPTPACYWDTHGSAERADWDLICPTPTATPEGSNG